MSSATDTSGSVAPYKTTTWRCAAGMAGVGAKEHNTMIQGCIINRQRDDLNSEAWYFVVVDEKIVLDRYEQLTRSTKRHKYRLINRYSRLDHRESISVDSVPFPQDVADEALSRITARFHVVKEWHRP